jgi:hypothetical protein
MTLPDLRALLGALVQAEVQFVVIGGIALVLQGGMRTTEDLDIVPAPDPANLDRLCNLLQAMRRWPAALIATTSVDRRCWPPRRNS